MGDTLESVLILLVSGVLVVGLFRKLHLPPLLGYLLVGVAVGPFALAWIPDTDEGRQLAEFASRCGDPRHGGAEEDEQADDRDGPHVDEAEQQEVLRWLLFDNHKFTSYFATYRFMRAFGPAAPDPAVLAFLKSRIDGAYGIVDKHLSGRDWLVGDAPTIADFSLSGYLFYPAEESGIDVARSHPHIGAWVQRLRRVDGWGDPYEVLPGERIAPRWVSA